MSTEEYQLSTGAGVKQKNICYVYVLDTEENLEPRLRVKNATYTCMTQNAFFKRKHS